MARLENLRRSLAVPEHASAAKQPPAHLQRIEVPMTCLDRRRVRRRLTAPDGTELVVALPTGTVMPVGHVLHVTAGAAYVVSAADEDTAVIHPYDLPQAVRVAHAIGNLHRDVYAEHGDLIALWDPPLELLLRRMRVPFTREARPFHGRPAWDHS